MGEETVLLDGFFDGEDLREIFVFDKDGTSAGSGTGFAIGYNDADGLAGREDFINGEEEFYS